MRNNRELSLLHSEIPSSLALLIHLPICLCDSYLGSPLCLGSPLFFYFLFEIPLNLHCFMMLMNPLRQNWSEKTEIFMKCNFTCCPGFQSPCSICHSPNFHFIFDFHLFGVSSFISFITNSPKAAFAY